MNLTAGRCVRRFHTVLDYGDEETFERVVLRKREQ